MLELKYKSEGLPNDKPRVYFTCHPDDFDRSFNAVTDDILRLSDCAIFYTEDMTQLITQEDQEHQLERMSLFVVPVTLKLLIEPNRAMDEDVPYAIAHNIPLLPIMLESGLDPVYSREDKFSDRKYLMPSRDTDGSGLTYEEKLRRFLNSVLWDAETAKRIRAAFDCTVFLSYRWKDRYHADNLMRLIHKNPLFRDVATWYDEYLVPGEGFNAAIAEALARSVLYTMVVTDNLVTDNNYIQTTEYPAARDLGKSILPADMGIEDSKRKQLTGLFDGIPDCVSTNDEANFYCTIEEILHNAEVSLRGKGNDPTHEYLMGLAYLYGIDVEVDRKRALELITSAAEAGLIDAIEKLKNMYLDGVGTDLNYAIAGVWAEKLVSSCEKEYGKESLLFLRALHEQAFVLGKLGLYEKAAAVNKEVVDILTSKLGEEDPQTLSALGNLAFDYCRYGDYEKALPLSERVYQIRRRVSGKDDAQTILALNNLAKVYENVGKVHEAFELMQKVYHLSQLVLGDNSQTTATILNNLAMLHSSMGNHPAALKAATAVYDYRFNTLGETHPDTLTSAVLLAKLQAEGAEYDIAKIESSLSLAERAYSQQCKVLGETHPDSLPSLLVIAQLQLQAQSKLASETIDKVYTLSHDVLGESNPLTQTAREWCLFLNIKPLTNAEKASYKEAYKKAIAYASTFFRHQDYLNAIEILEYTLDYVNGVYSNVTSLEEKLIHLNILALAEQNISAYEKALSYAQPLLSLVASSELNNDDYLFQTILLVASLQFKMERYEDAENNLTNLYQMQNKKLGNHHPEALITLGYLAMTYIGSGHVEKGIQLYESESSYIHQIINDESSPFKESLNNAWNVFFK